MTPVVLWNKPLVLLRAHKTEVLQQVNLEYTSSFLKEIANTHWKQQFCRISMPGFATELGHLDCDEVRVLIPEKFWSSSWN